MLGLRFLVVDDNKATVQLITAMLEKLGALDVTYARTGSEAANLLKSESRPFDCLLAKLMTRDGNGLQLLHAIRLGSIPVARQDMCVVLMSDALKESEARYARDLDVNGFLLRPFTVTRLVEEVRKARARVCRIDRTKYAAIPQMALEAAYAAA